MTLAVRLSLGFAIACALAYLATPYAIGLADRLQFYDKPAGYKGHLRPTPYLGGAAVMASPRAAPPARSAWAALGGRANSWCP